MVVVTDVKGSTPRDPGARMLVAGGRIVWGTIGGGKLELLARDHAKELLSQGRAVSETKAYPLAESAGQCCGGSVSVFFETFHWARPTIAIFGAGHVGQALASLAPWMGANVLLIDNRTEEELVPVPAPASARPYELVLVDAPEGELDELAPGSQIVIMTHSHALDLDLVEHALGRGAFPFIGLIGSDRKWQRFRQRLLARGLSPELVDTVHCPIGIGADARSKEPSAIALFVAAQLRSLASQEPVRD